MKMEKKRIEAVMQTVLRELGELAGDSYSFIQKSLSTRESKTA